MPSRTDPSERRRGLAALPGRLRRWLGRRMHTRGLKLLGESAAVDHVAATLLQWPAETVGQLVARVITKSPDDDAARLMAALGAALPPRRLVGLHEATLHSVQPMDYQAHEIRLTVTSNWERMRLKSVSKEPWTVAWIEENVQPGDVLYDIGANVGAYSLIAAKATGDRARVFAFEPGFASFAALCRNILLNGCQQSITPFSMALSDVTGLVPFKYRTVSAGAAFHALGDRRAGEPGQDDHLAPEYEQPMLGYRLDDFIDQFGLPAANHLKLDVDGCEFAVLRGADRLLANPQLRTLMLELEDNETGREIIDYLAAKGLKQTARFQRAGEETNRPISWFYGQFSRVAAAGSAERPPQAA